MVESLMCTHTPSVLAGSSGITQYSSELLAKHTAYKINSALNLERTFRDQDPLPLTTSFTPLMHTARRLSGRIFRNVTTLTSVP